MFRSNSKGILKKLASILAVRCCEVQSGQVMETYQLGQEIGVESFQEIPFVDVIGVSKGKGLSRGY